MQDLLLQNDAVVPLSNVSQRAFLANVTLGDLTVNKLLRCPHSTTRILWSCHPASFESFFATMACISCRIDIFGAALFTFDCELATFFAPTTAFVF